MNKEAKVAERIKVGENTVRGKYACRIEVMAAKGAGSIGIGKERKEKGSESRLEAVEERKGKAIMEAGKRRKKVTFKDNMENELREVIEDMKLEFLQEMKRMKERWENKVKALEDRVETLEEYIGELKEERRRREEEIEELRSDSSMS